MDNTQSRFHQIFSSVQTHLPKALSGLMLHNTLDGLRVTLSLSQTANTLQSLDFLRDFLMAQSQDCKLIGGQLTLDLNEKSADAMRNWLRESQ